jgi:L-aminopeptidase/D-esterase-like protein
MPVDGGEPILKPALATANTTIGIVATNARLTKSEAYRLAVMAQTGLARSLYPVHTPLDGDVIFAVSTGDIALKSALSELTYIGAAAANTVARAVSRGVYEAASAPQCWKGQPAWRTLFGERR